MADHTTHNKYGDHGTLEVIDYLELNEISPANIATYNHLGYYTDTWDYTDITLFYYNEEIFNEEIIHNPDIEYIIVWKRDIDRIGESMKYFDFQKSIGSYNIFKKNNPRLIYGEE